MSAESLELARVLAVELATQLGRRIDCRSLEPVSGGSIHEAYILGCDPESFFVKLGDPKMAAAFAAEAEGLEAIERIGKLRVPRPIARGEIAARAYLIVERLEFGAPSARGFAALGRALAEQHAIRAMLFGWSRDNFIGASAQPNQESGDWPAFWRDCRLLPQLKLAYANGHRGALQRTSERLLASVEEFFTSYRPWPALLHGDLWIGNVGFSQTAEPFVFDPAVYRGDREADLAMTELFGGFTPEFYSSYREHGELDVGYSVRKHLYNLYHVLNHLNLFGRDYARQAESMAERLLAELR